MVSPTPCPGTSPFNCSYWDDMIIEGSSRHVIHLSAVGCNFYTNKPQYKFTPQKWRLIWFTQKLEFLTNSHCSFIKKKIVFNAYSIKYYLRFNISRSYSDRFYAIKNVLICIESNNWSCKCSIWNIDQMFFSNDRIIYIRWTTWAMCF